MFARLSACECHAGRDSNDCSTKPDQAAKTMLLIPTPSLKAGMTLAQPIFHPSCDGCVLLSRQVVLSSKYIDSLQKLNVSYAWIAVSGFEEVDEQVSEEVSADHMRLFTALNNSVDQLEKRVEVKVNLHHYRKAVRGMLTSIVSKPDHEAITHQLATCGSELVGHLANSSYLSLLIGAHMTGYLRNQRSTLPPDVAENTSELGVGALLHDIGKMKMPDELLSKTVFSEEARWPEYQYHARAGYDMTREDLSVVASNTILNHHQRYDGTGFPIRASNNPCQRPEPLAGRKIHIFARIVSVVDAFTHMLCPNGKVVPTIMAIHGLKHPHLTGWFDPVVVETLMRLVPPFQLGTIVMLSDGVKGVVIGNHPEAPCRPLVRLVRGPLDKPGTKVSGRELDLRMCRSLTVASVNGIDIRGYLFSGELEPAPTVG